MIINGTCRVQPAFAGEREAKRLATALKEQSFLQFSDGVDSGDLLRAIGTKLTKTDMENELVQKARRKAIDKCHPIESAKEIVINAFHKLMSQVKK